MILEFIAACIGTVAFSLIYHVPRKYYPLCGVIGGCGWICYRIMESVCTVPEATFFATVVVIFMSRFFAVRQKCPVTIFLVSGIFPLVPGAGIYWTAYYLVMNETELALSKGLMTFKVAVAIVLGIVVVFELPQKLFRIGIKKDFDSSKI
ncbi:MAG: threonine/serine exporter family protein [Lachnospiraceae bacterium]